MTVLLKSPSMGKGWGVEVQASRYIPAGFARRMLFSEPLKKAKAFLQCEGHDYLFFEFWTDDEDLILAAVEFIHDNR